MTGVFITFEGPDGGGKTTQLQRTAQFLRRRGIDVDVTREPGGTALGEAIRSWLLTPAVAGQEMTLETEALLYAAARRQHVSERLLPALRSGKVVLCDRYVDASYAYQAYGNGLSLAWVEAVNRPATEQLMPTRTYLLDVPVEVARRRLLRRSGDGMDRIERRGEAYHRRVREGFLALAAREPKRIVVIDATKSEADVTAAILRDLTVLLAERFPTLMDGAETSL
jgi:dTMP kinase